MNAAAHSVAETANADPAARLALLRLLEQHPEYSQRQLAAVLGISLGKTHYLLKALLGKGLVKVQNFRRSDRKIGYLYRLTPQGAVHRIRLTQLFLVRKEHEYEILREQIGQLREELAAVDR